MEYDSSGNFVDSIALPSSMGSETRGIAFGPDNLLYVAMVRDSGFVAYALDSTGAVQQIYHYNHVYVGGNLSLSPFSLERPRCRWSSLLLFCAPKLQQLAHQRFRLLRGDAGFSKGQRTFAGMQHRLQLFQ
jgi:hypothetical protein